MLFSEMKLFKKLLVILFILICLILFGCSNIEKNNTLEIYTTLCENGCLKMTVLNLEAGLYQDEQLLVECQDYCKDFVEDILE